jgi:hypothetical protein
MNPLTKGYNPAPVGYSWFDSMTGHCLEFLSPGIFTQVLRVQAKSYLGRLYALVS